MTDSPDPSLAELRVDYSLDELDERFVQPDPLDQFGNWLAEARAAGLPEPNAMVLATVSPEGDPSTRAVLLKAIDASGLTFFTNYNSHKARDLAANPRASVTFLWVDLQRQVHVRGRVEKTSFGDSEAYFQTRPYLSQIGAYASEQSAVLPNRAWLEERFAELEKKYPHGEVPVPANWGGFRLVPHTFEFWQGRRNRLHDRIRYVRIDGAGWRIERLSP